MRSLMTTLVLFLALTSVSRADISSVHGMLLFGRQTNYASHLPMFHAPHDCQLILKLDLLQAGTSQALALYRAAQEAGETFFTLVPERMDLSQVASGVRTSFSASIFRGHFERGGQELGAVRVHVSAIVSVARLNGDQAPQANEEYFIFGESGETFAAHLIHEKPSFDAILSVSSPYRVLSGTCRRRACPGEPDPVRIPVGLPVTTSEAKIRQPFTTPSEGAVLGSAPGPHAKILKTIYLEEEDLAH